MAIKPGDTVEWTSYGETRRGVVLSINPASVAVIRHLGGPMIGRLSWKHPESLTLVEVN